MLLLLLLLPLILLEDKKRQGKNRVDQDQEKEREKKKEREGRRGRESPTLSHAHSPILPTVGSFSLCVRAVTIPNEIRARKRRVTEKQLKEKGRRNS